MPVGACAAAGWQDDYVLALPVVQDFLAGYQARTGSAPPPAFRQYLAYGYDAMAILLCALDQVAEPQPDGGLAINRAR